MNVRQYNGVNRAVTFILLLCLFILLLCLPHCILWHSFYCSVYPILSSDIHFTPLFTSLYCLTFIFTALFTSLYCLTFIWLLCLFISLLCLPHCVVWHSFYCSVYPIALSDIHFTALFTPFYRLTFIVLLCIPHCIVWHSLYCSVYSFYCSVYLIVFSDIHFSNRAVKWMSDNTMG